MLLLVRAAQRSTAQSRGAQQCARACAAVALRTSSSSQRHAPLMSATQRQVLPTPLRGDRSWRARGGAQQRGSAAAYAASAAVGANDDDASGAAAADHPKAPRPQLFKYIAAFAVFGLAGNCFGARRLRRAARSHSAVAKFISCGVRVRAVALNLALQL
jgi:hypothetical protein